MHDIRSSFLPVRTVVPTVLALSIITLVVQGGTLMTVPALLPRMAGDFGPMGTVATTLLVTMSVGNLLAGWLIGRWDARAVVAVGMAVAAAGWLAGSAAQDRIMLTAALALTGVGIALSTMVPGIAIITRDVRRKRGLALGIFLGATILGGAIVPPALTMIDDERHWRSAMVVAGIAMLAAMPLLLVVGRGAAAEMANGPDAVRVGPSSRLGGMVAVVIAMTMVQLSINGILFASVDGLMRQGLDHGQAVMAFGIANLMGLPALIAGGWVADRVGGRAAFAGSALLLAGGSAALLAAAPYGIAGVAAFVLLWGMASALPGQTGAMAIAEVAPQGRFPALLGMTVAVVSLLGALAPALTDYMLARGSDLAGVALTYAAFALGGAMLAVPGRSLFTR